jgi:drug/metabolite transporter (DMT)-like permease
MEITAFALVVAGAFMHAGWNFLAKRVSGGLAFVWLYGVVSLVLALPITVFAWLANPQSLSGVAFAAAVASAVLHVVYSLVLQRGYQVSDFSVVYPMARGTGPLFSVFGAVLLLHEAPNAAGWIGIALILAGVFVVSGGVKTLTKPSGPRVRSGVAWGGLTGILIACYTVVDGWAIKSLGASPILFYGVGLLFRTLLVTPFALRDTSRLRQQWQQHARSIAAVGILSPCAYVLVLFAVKMAPLSYVAPARELSMLIGAYMGAKLLNEQDIRLRSTGAVLMGLGVLALGLGTRVS